MKRLALIVLALMLASCRREAPTEEAKQSQDQQPTSAKAPAPTSGPLTIEWTDRDIEKTASQVAYGSRKEGTLLERNPDGALVFRPGSAKDHVAMQFTPLQAYTGDRSLELVLDVDSPGGKTCAANLQDQGFNVLATVPCTTAGEQKATAKVPPTATSVRVYFLSSTQEPIRLPRRMRVVEHR